MSRYSSDYSSDYETRDEYILVMGATGAGKTSFINAVTDSTLRISHGLETCTSQIYESRPIEFAGRTFILLDTPGFDDSNKTDAEVLTEISLSLGRYYKRRDRIIGVIYLHDINNTRMSGTAVRNVAMFRRAVGDAAADNVVIVTSKWDRVDPMVGERRQTQLAYHPQFFGNIVEAGATMERYQKGENPSRIFQAIIRGYNYLPLQIQWEIVDKKKKIGKTAAGQLLSTDIKQTLKDTKTRYKEQLSQLKKHQDSLTRDEMKQMKTELKKARDEKTKSLDFRSSLLNRKINNKI